MAHRPSGRRAENQSSVRYRTRLSDLKNKQSTESGPEMSSIIRISDGFSAEFLGSFSHSQKFHRVTPCRVRRSRDGGPEIRALIAAAVPWLARAMAAETRLLIGHTSLSAAAAAVRTPMIAHALVLHSRHRWKGDWRCLLGRGGPHACSVRQWCVWSSTHSPH